MALSLRTVLAFSLTLCVLLQEGFGLPLSGESESPGHSVPKRVRTKRCSCNNWLDKECIYFCHLDIIWVNTPSKTTPYGLGSPLSRRRRSTGRCECANPNDPTCTGFCHNSTENPGLVVVIPVDQRSYHVDRTNRDLLTSIRQVVKANLVAAEQSASPRKKASRTSRPRIS